MDSTACHSQVQGLGNDGKGRYERIYLKSRGQLMHASKWDATTNVTTVSGLAAFTLSSLTPHSCLVPTSKCTTTVLFMCTRPPPSTQTHTPTPTHARAHTHMHTRPHAHPHAHTHTHAHTYTHAPPAPSTAAPSSLALTNQSTPHAPLAKPLKCMASASSAPWNQQGGTCPQ